MIIRRAHILVLCKTYPSPSAKHAETSCVAGLEDSGRLIRLYPVPFRAVDDKHKFKKWQWITALVEPALNDRRQESHRIKIDTISIDGNVLTTSDNWKARRCQIDRLPLFEDFAALESTRQASGVTLALLRPSRIKGLEITPTASLDWTDEERGKLLQLQQQGNLFDNAESRSLTTLRKVPFEFHYRYECATLFGQKIYRHKIVDWEAGALFWNVCQQHQTNWEEPFRAKLEHELPSRDLMFLMGTIHRFPDQWLIISLIYPPKPRERDSRQQALL